MQKMLIMGYEKVRNMGRSHCDTDVFRAFLDEAAKSITPTRKRNILILDNTSWHKRKSLDWHFFEPLYLPP
jgi:hypothetical protein